MMWGWNDSGLGIFVMVLFWVVVVAAVWVVVRRLPSDQHEHGKSVALGELGVRFARGEIDEEEFERRRSILERAGS